MKWLIAIFLFFSLITDPSDVSASTIDSYSDIDSYSEYLDIEMNDVQISGDYLPPYSFYGTDWVNGKFLGNGYSHMSDRFDVFANEYECDCYIGLWSSLEKSGFDSFEDLIESWSQYYMDDDTVCILYIDETKDAYVHVGENITQQFDADGFINVLCEEEEKDEFYRIADAFDNLCDQVGQGTGEYPAKVTGIGGSLDEKAVKDALIPLHEVFSGYVCVDYYIGDATDQTSMLRRSREIDYDAEFDVWEHELEYYYYDTIYITYYSDTGKAYIDIGKNTGIGLSNRNIENIEAVFEAATGENDFSGFSSGVTALAEKISDPDAGVEIILVGVVLAAAALLVTGIAVKRKRSVKD